MNELSALAPESLLLELVFQVLRDGNDAQAQLASEILYRLGQPPIELLFLQALNCEKPKRYRLRVLVVLRHFLTQLDDTESLLYLEMLCEDRHLEIRIAAEGLLRILQRRRAGPIGCVSTAPEVAAAASTTFHEAVSGA